jgi:hypothetical protein
MMDINIKEWTAKKKRIWKCVQNMCEHSLYLKRNVWYKSGHVTKSQLLWLNGVWTAIIVTLLADRCRGFTTQTFARAETHVNRPLLSSDFNQTMSWADKCCYNSPTSHIMHIFFAFLVQTDGQILIGPRTHLETMPAWTTISCYNFKQSHLIRSSCLHSVLSSGDEIQRVPSWETGWHRFSSGPDFDVSCAVW